MAGQKTYVCRRARMCTHLMEHGFHPYKVSPDRDNPVYDVFLFTATPELYRAVTEYVSKRSGEVEIRLHKEDWLNVLEALDLAEDDRVEQANNAMDDEDEETCMGAAAAYASVAAAIRRQMEGGEKDD